MKGRSPAFACPAPFNGPRRNDGFTLIEILIVLAIMGMIAGMIVWHGALRSTSTDLDAAREAATGAIRMARDDALLSGAPRAIVLMPDRHTIAVTTARGVMRVGLGRPVASPENWHGVLRPDGTAVVPPLALREAGQIVTLGADPLTGRVERR